MTNADRIRNMTDEELFEFLTRTMNVLDTCVICTHYLLRLARIPPPLNKV